MFLFNASASNTPLQRKDSRALDIRAAEEAARIFSSCPVYTPTPLLPLTAMAKDLGLGSVFVKDESARLGLGSFKALGGSFAVMSLVLSEAAARVGRVLRPVELRAPEVRAAAAEMVVACATDGNHGRSVAAGARLSGCHAEIFVHEHVSERRVAAIADLGARITRVPGAYDNAVAEALKICRQRDWHVVSDTSWPGYEDTPLKVMQGYTVMVREALQSLAIPPTHVFVQAGVGGLAAAIAGYFDAVFGASAPVLIVVEPSRAACLLESYRSGRRVAIGRGEPTVMAMLECYEPSEVAWRILKERATAFMTVDESDAVEAMRTLARPLQSDPAIVAGESGGVGLAGLVRVLRTPRLRGQLKLDGNARVLLFNTEGATDPVLYRELTGIEPNARVGATLTSHA